MRKKKKDIVIILVVLGIALVAFAVNYFMFQKEGEVYAEIYVGSELVETVDLSKDRVFSVEQRPQITFKVENHTIAFVQSDCSDKVCIHSGYLGKNGQSAACLPNETILRIRSEEKNPDEPDIVAAKRIDSKKGRL